MRIEFYQSLQRKPGARLPNVGEEVILPIDVVHPYTGADRWPARRLHYFAKFYYTVAEDGKIISIFGFPPEMQKHATLPQFEKLILDEINRPRPKPVEYKTAELLFFDDFDDGSMAGWTFLEGERGFMEEPYNQWNDVTWVGPQSTLRNKPPDGKRATADADAQS